MRATKQQVEARVNDLLRIMLDGAEAWDLRDFVREKEQQAGSHWYLAEDEKPLSYSQIRRYAVKANRLVAQSCRASSNRLLRRHLAKRRNLYAKAVSQGDIRAALACLKDEAELLNLYAKAHQEADKEDEDIDLSGCTDEEIAFLERILDRLGRADADVDKEARKRRKGCD